MDIGLHQFAKGFVYTPVALQLIHSREHIADDQKPVMTVAVTRAFVADVFVALVVKLQGLRCKNPLQAIADFRRTLIWIHKAKSANN